MKGKLIAVGLVLTMFAGLGVAIAQSSGWNFGRFQSFMQGIGVGTKLQTGMVTARAQGSREIFTFQKLAELARCKVFEGTDCRQIDRLIRYFL